MKPDFSGEFILIRSASDDNAKEFTFERFTDGRRLRATEQIRGGGRDQDNVWEFERH